MVPHLTSGCTWPCQACRLGHAGHSSRGGTGPRQCHSIDSGSQQGQLSEESIQTSLRLSSLHWAFITLGNAATPDNSLKKRFCCSNVNVMYHDTLFLRILWAVMCQQRINICAETGQTRPERTKEKQKALIRMMLSGNTALEEQCNLSKLKWTGY